ncbi:MAG: GH3 auxin-responsive promoter family protein [Weeksellaceae bacterium]|jgi:phenylacetate-coenzyme A ligase PaaK-like adenylate-forming protein|nr:GH3 auxin-responsive promoter family protein [Weeksellaceae bacterium]
MKIKSELAKIFAKINTKREQSWILNPIAAQEKVFKTLISKAENTRFGKDHNFKNIQSYEDFKQQVPIRDYEDLKSYIELIQNGESDVLWKGRPIYFAKTSGTTSGTKFIPITKESMPHHIQSARDALLDYIAATKQSDFVSGKMIFLQGNPELEETNGIKTGRLSGIVAHYVPKYLQKNRMPNWETNCIEDWETKIDKIVDETLNENMTLIGGIPPWLIMYFERLLKKSGKKNIKEIFPNFKLMVTGGVNYNPYRQKMIELIGENLDVIQTYPASEGFFAYQNSIDSDDLLLLVQNGIFYEFIPVEEFFDENPTRISLKDVELNRDYVLILNTNAGLWGYNIGDTIRFTNLKPYKIIVSGRIKHFTSAFGEHVIAHEVEQAMRNTLEKFPSELLEFTVAPQVHPENGLPYHEWFIEFGKQPDDLENFAEELDRQMRKMNSYYDDLISGKTLQRLKISQIRPNGFNELMKSQGKLGGQNKIARLSNDRKIAEQLYDLKLILN